MNSKAIKFKDTWAAPGSQLHQALVDGDINLATKIYHACERDLKKLEGREDKNRWAAEQASAFFGIPLKEIT